MVDQEGVKPLLEYAKEELFSRLWHLWLYAATGAKSRVEARGREAPGVDLVERVRAKLPRSK